MFNQLSRERTQAGIAAAQARGQHCGRRASLTPTQAKHAAELIPSGKSEREVGRILGVSHTSIRRALARITELPEDDSIPPPKK